ncbi:MAG: hypothetical protein DWQ10_07770 [Calditrichaeota bacterium]|nr:MAG: hypothetical protein DWQ10_07770 [Calditrichota bacterium]
MIKKLKKTLGRQLLSSYKKKVQNAFDPSLDHCLASARALMQKAKYCYLITHSERDWPSARMVQPIVEPDSFVVWFGTDPKLRKVAEIKKNPNVTIAFGDEGDNANLILYGKATLVEDMQERRKQWKNSWHLFFPGGSRGENFVSIRVEPVEMELMHFKKNIVPEPFGLNPVKLIISDAAWRVEF